jgi:hypothetical protein
VADGKIEKDITWLENVIGWALGCAMNQLCLLDIAWISLKIGSSGLMVASGSIGSSVAHQFGPG